MGLALVVWAPSQYNKEGAILNSIVSTALCLQYEEREAIAFGGICLRIDSYAYLSESLACDTSSGKRTSAG
ncbi:hypothetical protein KC336_g22 [Hortaea werneckii]|nr:hypothetical protein KC336_g22 [Hortaea werneckii]